MRGFSLTRIWTVARKEFLHLRRDRLTGGLIAGIPIVMTLLFGYAINNDVRNLNAAVVDESATSASRALVADIRASQVLRYVAHAASVGELERQIATAEISRLRRLERAAIARLRVDLDEFHQEIPGQAIPLGAGLLRREPERSEHAEGKRGDLRTKAHDGWLTVWRDGDVP